MVDRDLDDIACVMMQFKVGIKESSQISYFVQRIIISSPHFTISSVSNLLCCGRVPETASSVLPLFIIIRFAAIQARILER